MKDFIFLLRQSRYMCVGQFMRLGIKPFTPLQRLLCTMKVTRPRI
jgi:hypothetical protein